MQRPTRNSSLKALVAIKENTQFGTRSTRTKKQSSTTSSIDSENLARVPINGGVKRHCSPTAGIPPNPKRKTALVDLTNNAVLHSSFGNKPSKKQQINTTVEPSKMVTAQQQPAIRRSTRLKGKNTKSSTSSSNSSMEEDPKLNTSGDTLNPKDTPLTAVQNILKATTLDDDSLRCEECLPEEQAVLEKSSSNMPIWKDIDEAESHDPLFSSEYAPEIYEYMKRREVMFTIDPYLDNQPFIDAKMRTILVDWLVEVQENFELFHETLYLAVKIVDRYLERKEVKKEYLQLVGATAMLVASKFEELSPPLVDDFIYLCDDAYTHTELLNMETNILCTMDYDLNVPVAYRFLRRYARAADADLPLHTLARYVCESTLQEYEFVPDKPSLIAAASMYLAVRMKKHGTWTLTLQHYSGYSISDLIPMVHRLNDLISRPPSAVGSSNGNAPTPTSTVRSKYSHSVFFEVALITPLQNVNEDADKAMAELQVLTQ